MALECPDLKFLRLEQHIRYGHDQSMFALATHVGNIIYVWEASRYANLKSQRREHKTHEHVKAPEHVDCSCPHNKN